MQLLYRAMTKQKPRPISDGFHTKYKEQITSIGKWKDTSHLAKRGVSFHHIYNGIKHPRACHHNGPEAQVMELTSLYEDTTLSVRKDRLSSESNYMKGLDSGAQHMLKSVSGREVTCAQAAGALRPGPQNQQHVLDHFNLLNLGKHRSTVLLSFLNMSL